MPILHLPQQVLIDDRDQEVSYEYKIFESNLGDGYRQLAANGINNETRVVSLSYKNLRPTEYNEVLSFVRSLKGYQPCLYALPGEAASLWTVDSTFSTSQTAISNSDPTLIVRSIKLTLKTYYAY